MRSFPNSGFSQMALLLQISHHQATRHQKGYGNSPWLTSVTKRSWKILQNSWDFFMGKSTETGNFQPPPFEYRRLSGFFCPHLWVLITIDICKQHFARGSLHPCRMGAGQSPRFGSFRPSVAIPDLNIKPTARIGGRPRRSLGQTSKISPVVLIQPSLFPIRLGSYPILVLKAPRMPTRISQIRSILLLIILHSPYKLLGKETHH